MLQPWMPPEWREGPERPIPKSGKVGDRINAWTLREFMGHGMWLAECSCGHKRYSTLCRLTKRCWSCYVKDRRHQPRKEEPAPVVAPRVKVSDITTLLCDSFGITPEVMRSRARSRRIVRPRQMAITLARELTDQSFPAIARTLGLRDHTSAMWAQEHTYLLEQESQRIADNMEHFRLALLTFKAQQAVTLMGHDRGND